MDQDYEVGRLDALRRLGLLDTPPSEAFDRITRMASQIFALSISAVSLTDFDRQWFKSRVGLDLKAIPRRLAPCAAVAATRKSLVVENLLDDETYRESFLADAGVRFYAGAPLTTREGFCLGSMCVLGMSPRQVSTTEMDSLSDLAAMVMSQIELQHAFGRVDPLSSMPNRNQFLEDLDDLARDRPQRERRLAVMVDLATPEQLSVAARVMGPAYLDEMVQEAAQMIRTGLGAGLKPYHIAPTQFVFIAPPEVEEQGFDELLAQTLHPLSNRLDPRFMTTMVIGGAPFTLGQARPRDVLRTVHSAAQDARGAHTRISLYSSVHDAIHRRRFQILQEFRAALESGDQMRLVYQPRVDTASGVCHGAEALLRWQHPTLGEISPGEFIPLVEQTSMARATTAWVLEAALRQLARWRDTGFNLQLSVNVSAANLVEQDFVTRALDGLQQYALPAACLELEVTESAVMGDAGQALAVLEALANAGIRLAIDDFGTGYTSLSYLQRLPAHVVKIDQSFMQEVEGDERTRGLVAAMIALSHDLGYRVVAEGVETTRTLEILRQAGCDEVQGYLFGRPMPAEALEQWCAGAELALAC